MNRQEKIEKLKAELKELEDASVFQAEFEASDDAPHMEVELDLDGDFTIGGDDLPSFWIAPEAQDWLLEQLQRAKNIREGNN